MTLTDAYDAFMLYGKMYWADRTKHYYDRNISYFLRYLKEQCHISPDADLSDLPDTVLVEYLIWLRAKERFSDHPQRPAMDVTGKIKSNTVNSYMRAVKRFFNYLYEQEYTSVSFTRKLKLPKADDDQIIPLLAGEVAAIDNLFDRTIPMDLRNLCMIHLMLDAGLRSCEVMALQVEDLLFSSSAIVINRSKGEKSRAVIMCPSLASLLQDYIDAYRPSGSLFTCLNSGKNVNSSVFRSLFLRIRRRTGIDRVHPHLLRHTFATSFIMGGGNLESLRILLGHYDYSVTRKYLHLAAQYQILGTDIYRLDPVFFKSAY